MSGPIAIIIGGVTLAGAFLVGKVGVRAIQRMQSMPKAPRGLRSLPKGGFEPKMSRREAALIVAINERNISKQKLNERYKTVMLANHPDRGGSPYLALKINEAKRTLEPFAR